MWWDLQREKNSTGLWTPSQKQWQMKGAAPLKCNNPAGDCWEGGQPNIYVITLPFFTTAWIFVIEKSRQETREFEQVTTMSPGKSWRSGLPYLHEASAVRKHILVKPQLLYCSRCGVTCQAIGHSKRSVRLRQVAKSAVTPYHDSNSGWTC